MSRDWVSSKPGRRRPGVGILRTVAFQIKALAIAVEDFGWRTGAVVRVAELRSGTTIRTLTLAGSPPMLVRLGRGQTDLATFRHVWKERCYEIDSRVFELVIDAGSNVGYAARWFATRYPNCRVVAVEPDRANLELLHANVAGLSQVEVFVGALMSSPGQFKLVDVGQADSFRVGSLSHGVEHGDVTGITVSQILETEESSSSILLKLDVEGAEMEVLQQCGSWIGRISALVVELHDRFQPGCTRAFMNAVSEFEVQYPRGENWFALRTASIDVAA
jgi:FkbM family methyltransferase